ncbi:unnamed protein product [Dicrocoelium dendriticum]|nr:unnamed protein product [Dicrocoelium dendriticum]
MTSPRNSHLVSLIETRPIHVSNEHFGRAQTIHSSYIRGGGGVGSANRFHGSTGTITAVVSAANKLSVKCCIHLINEGGGEGGGGDRAGGYGWLITSTVTYAVHIWVLSMTPQ